jgi:predicted acyltransferase
VIQTSPAAGSSTRREAPVASHDERGPGQRLVSLDAFRGLTMIWMISEGFGLSAFRGHPVLGPVAEQFRHQDWHGMNAWDLIQPFFMFIVGVAMPYSFGKRWAAGEPWSRSLLHVLRRSALLIIFGLVARSIQANKPVIDLINVLAQIAFTYLVAFLILRLHWMAQAGVALALLGVHTALYEFATAPGVLGPWVQDANIGWYLDMRLLGKTWSGSYATINFLSSAANTIFGVLAGELLISSLPSRKKLTILLTVGVACIGLGLALDPVIPIIKKIWTASFAIYSTGFTLIALAAFHWICDVRGRVRWAKLLIIVGANSIFIYLFHEMLNRWLHQAATVFLGWSVTLWGPAGQVLIACALVAFQIYVCWWLWRRRIFFKL